MPSPVHPQTQPPRPNPNSQWGKYEHHITGDVALVYQQYWRLSGDKAWLQAKGNEVAQATALYWSSRVTANLDGSFSIKGVMGPDEFHYPVDDSAYTNAIARISLDFALEAAAALGTAPAAGNFSHIADNLRIIVDRLRQIHPEFAGYLGSQVKQADTVLLGFPLLARNLTRTLRANDLLYYESRTDPNGPAMTYAMFAVGWLDVGNHTKAQQLFVRGYANVQAPFYIWTETPSGGCRECAAARADAAQPLPVLPRSPHPSFCPHLSPSLHLQQTL